MTKKNCKSFYSRFFMETAQMISPYILIHLMCSVILMAIALFLLDLVRIAFLMNLTLNLIQTLIFPPIPAISINELRYYSRCHNGRCCYAFPFCILLFWKIGIQKLWRYGCLHFWSQLAAAAFWFTKVFDFNDWKYATTNVLSWFWCRGFELGDILQGKTIFFKIKNNKK